MPPTIQQSDPEAAGTRAVLKTIGTFTRAFQGFETDTMTAVWTDDYITSTDETGIIYQAEERLAPIFTIADLKKYADNLPNVLSHLEDVSLLDRKVSIAGDVAYAYIRFWCRAVMTSGAAVDGQVRQTFILRKRDDGWAIVHYHESRQSPGFE
jgi:ketosteroid isomerase-like protein